MLSEGNIGLGYSGLALRGNMVSKLEIVECCLLTRETDGNYARAADLLQSAVEFLELGRREWAAVPRSDRGVIFVCFVITCMVSLLTCATCRSALFSWVWNGASMFPN